MKFGSDKKYERLLEAYGNGDVSRRDIGFDAEDNEVLLIDRWGGSRELPRMAKSAVADAILDAILALRTSHPARRAVR